MKNNVTVLDLGKLVEFKLTNKVSKKLEAQYKMPVMKITQTLEGALTAELENLLFELLFKCEMAKADFIDLLDENDISSTDMLITIIEVFTNAAGNEEEQKAKIEKITGKKLETSPNE
jgi:hypothetical protein